MEEGAGPGHRLAGRREGDRGGERGGGEYHGWVGLVRVFQLIDRIVHRIHEDEWFHDHTKQSKRLSVRNAI